VPREAGLYDRRSSERTESQFPQGIYLLRCIYQANAVEQSPLVVPMTKALDVWTCLVRVARSDLRWGIRVWATRA